MRKIVVTGAGCPLGLRIVEALNRLPAVESVHAVESKTSREDRWDLLIDRVQIAPDHRPFVEYLEERKIDTVVQCGLLGDRSGADTRSGEADVIMTMCLGAAIAHTRSEVRNWVLLSSSAFYPIGSRSPLIQSEDSNPLHDETGIAASIAEAEDYARDIALRHPHLNVSILRLQELIGAGVRGPLAALLGETRVPIPVGFDPAVQFLHVDDAASATAFAAAEELAGVYNVASKGTIHWSDALRVADRRGVPVLPIGAASLEPVLRALKIPYVPAQLREVMRFGHAVDTQKLERIGWKARFDQAACVATLRGK